MPNDAIGLFVQLGVAGVMLYLFVIGKLIPKSAMDEALKRADYDKEEMRIDRDSWRAIALGNESRLDQAAPIVETAIKQKQAPSLADDYDAADAAMRRSPSRRRRQE